MKLASFDHLPRGFAGVWLGMNFMPARQIELAVAQRAKGRLGLAFKRDGARTRVEEFYQQGCLKARLPRPAEAGVLEAVTMNIGGGVAGGDVLATRIELHPGAQACVASQAAERVYRALAEPAEVSTEITVHPGAMLAYLPQETILFDGFGLNRSLEIALHGDAAFLGVESVVFGRLAMGEAVRLGALRDRITLKRDGRVVLRDMTRLEGDISAQLGRQAVARGAVAAASLVFARADAADYLDAVRGALGEAHAGASCFEGVLFARILAPTGAALRRIVVAALNVLRDGQPMPRVWQG